MSATNEYNNEYKIHVQPSTTPNDGEFRFTVFAPNGEGVAAGYSHTQQAAIEAARLSAKRHAHYPPHKEVYTP